MLSWLSATLHKSLNKLFPIIFGGNNFEKYYQFE